MPVERDTVTRGRPKTSSSARGAHGQRGVVVAGLARHVAVFLLLLAIRIAEGRDRRAQRLFEFVLDWTIWRRASSGGSAGRWTWSSVCEPTSLPA